MSKSTQYEESEESDDEFIIDEYKSLSNPIQLNKEYQKYKQINKPSSSPIHEKILKLFLKLVKKYYKLGIFTILLISTILFFNLIRSNNEITTIIDNSSFNKKFNHLQLQINEIQNKQNQRLNDFMKYFDMKLNDFNNKFNELDKFNEKMIKNIEQLELTNIIKQKNNDDDDDDVIIPIIKQGDDIKLIPEFERYLQNRIKSMIQEEEEETNDKFEEFKLNYKNLVKDYTQELIQDKIGFINKQEIISLISNQFHHNKEKLIEEIKKITKNNNNGDNSNIIDSIPQKLINNQHNMAKKTNNNSKNIINYSLSSNGARIINYLTSSTFHPKLKPSISNYFQKKSNEISPFIMLTNNEGYWKSGEINSTIGIKFLEPIYITNFKYNHNKPINGGLLTSCPKYIQLYFEIDKEYQLIGEFEYDLNEKEEQEFKIPDEYQTILVKSILIKTFDNYGNNLYTSFYKFSIEGMTKFDVYSTQQLLRNKEIDATIKDLFVKSFGDDSRL